MIELNHAVYEQIFTYFAVSTMKKSRQQRTNFYDTEAKYYPVLQPVCHIALAILACEIRVGDFYQSTYL